MKEKINEILAKEGFVEKMLACEEPEQVQALFAAEGIELTIEEVKAIGRGLELASTEGDELSEELLARHAVAFAELYGHRGGVSRADEDAERGEEHHDREHERYARHSGLAAAVADVEPVYYRIEGVEGHRDERGP